MRFAACKQFDLQACGVAHVRETLELGGHPVAQGNAQRAHFMPVRLDLRVLLQLPKYRDGVLGQMHAIDRGREPARKGLRPATW
ncbi:MAG: hypothetical protein U0744_20380 [Gemmataceae bacterium]